MRLLHVRPDHVGGGVASRSRAVRRRGREGTDERQHLPLRRLPQHRGRDPECAAKHEPAESRMKPFEFTRADDPAAGDRRRGQGEDGAAGRGHALHRRRDDAAST